MLKSLLLSILLTTFFSLAFCQPLNSSTIGHRKSKKKIELSSPIVVFEPDGRPTVAEKKDLNDKLLIPYFKKVNDDGLNTIVVVINVPEKMGDAYGVLAISPNGSYDSFLFSKRGAISKWRPEEGEE